MTVINLILGFCVVLGLIFTTTDRALLTPSIFPPLLTGISYIILWLIQPILVYKWAKEHNKKLQKATTVNT